MFTIILSILLAPLYPQIVHEWIVTKDWHLFEVFVHYAWISKYICKRLNPSIELYTYLTLIAYKRSTCIDAHFLSFRCWIDIASTYRLKMLRNYNEDSCFILIQIATIYLYITAGILIFAYWITTPGIFQVHIPIQRFVR